MHYTLHKELSLQTALLQFYCFLSRGFFTKNEVSDFFEYCNENIEKIHNMQSLKWDGRYDLILERINKTKNIIETAKSFLNQKQHCDNDKIAEYMHNHPDFYRDGIMLNDLKEILDINVMFRNGYMLHDFYHGYPEKGKYRYRIDCIDFLYSAKLFYNEGYDYYNNRKEIKKYDPYNINKIPHNEFVRIQQKEEVMFTNFREAYINIIFFVESFINSVGYDAYLSGLAKSIEEENNLKGIQSLTKSGHKRYSSLKQRITDFSRIINGSPINTEKEPYKSYLNKEVELRNQYVHSSPEKGKIQLSQYDWKDKCDIMINNKCFEFLNAFWKSCYPNKAFPKVIYHEFHCSSFKGFENRYITLE